MTPTEKELLATIAFALDRIRHAKRYGLDRMTSREIVLEDVETLLAEAIEKARKALSGKLP